MNRSKVEVSPWCATRRCRENFLLFAIRIERALSQETSIVRLDDSSLIVPLRFSLCCPDVMRGDDKRCEPCASGLLSLRTEQRGFALGGAALAGFPLSRMVI